MKSRGGGLVETLSGLRQKLGLTQKELHEKTGIPMSSIAMYEIGERMPSLKRAKKLAKFFEVPIEEIAFGKKVHNE